MEGSDSQNWTILWDRQLFPHFDMGQIKNNRGSMDKVLGLHDYTTKLLDVVDMSENRMGKKELGLVVAKLKNLKSALSGALHLLEVLGGFGVFDKEVLNGMKSGLDRVQFLLEQSSVFHFYEVYKGKGCNFNSLVMCGFGTGVDDEHEHNNYLKNLTNEILRELPSFADDPESMGCSFVKKFDMTVFERVMIEKEIVTTSYMLSPTNEDDLDRVLVVPIFGMAGTGKTSLASLVSIDPRIKQHFDIIDWHNISGLSTGLDILHKVATRGNPNDQSLMGISTSTVRLEQTLEGKRYLLLLENLFEEYDGSWFELLEPLLSISPNCKHGSRLLVTSRSMTLRNQALDRLPMVSPVPHMLKPPPMKESLALFLSIAFREVAEEDRDPDLIKIAVKICNKCANNLHTITIVASILSFQPTNLNRWLYFNDILLESIENPIEAIHSVADLIQTCYEWGPTFCSFTSLFPFEYKFSKVDLHPLWELQGYSAIEQSTKKFNEYFDKLLNIGYFFEDSKTNRPGDTTVYYKINVLLQEVVQHHTRDEWRLLDMFTTEVDAANWIQNVSFVVDSTQKIPSWFNHAKQLKTLFFFPTKSFKFIHIPNINEILLNMKALRALDLAMVHFNIYPDFLGELKQLRYLKLGISLESFPNCIISLRHLQTLDLRQTAIKELPSNFCELEGRLNCFYTGCRLIDLPPRFVNFYFLQILDEFIVGKNNGLYHLAGLPFLVGKLKIRYQNGRSTLQQVESNFLVKLNLDNLSLTWSSSNDDQANNIYKGGDASEFEFLQPPPTLESLSIKGWKGVRFPQWAMDGFSILLKSLISLQIIDCSVCQQLPTFNSLPHLRSLRLQGLSALEWLEIPNEHTQIASSSSSFSKTAYFPSLKYLMLANLPQLKGWSKVDNNHQLFVHQHETFECLTELKVIRCPMIISMPLVPTLEKLEVVNVHGKLLQHVLNAQGTSASSSSSSSFTLKKLHIKSVHELESLTITIPSLEVLTIRECKDLADVFINPTNTLKRLQIQACFEIKHISQIMHNLTVLEKLEIDGWQESDLVTDDSARVAWQGLKSLRLMTLINISRPQPFLKGLEYINKLEELSLCWLYNLSILPESIGYLSGLTRLVIQNCPNVKRIPEYFPNLKSLKRLEIKECTKLQKRCEQPDGEDCHLIQHILPGVYLGEWPTPED